MAPTQRSLRLYALLISIVSIIYCAAEGAVSIALGADSKSRSLIFFGIQSAIEVASACIVTWRFWGAVRDDYARRGRGSSSGGNDVTRGDERWKEESEGEKREREARNLR